MTQLKDEENARGVSSGVNQLSGLLAGGHKGAPGGSQQYHQMAGGHMVRQ